jgi:predicted ATPase
VQAEFLYQRGVPPQATYRFKHALIQEAAYQSLLKSTRQQYHQRIAQVLAAQFPDTAATQPELVAQHYTAAGLSAQALPFWQWAGERALQRSANAEAISHLTTALEVLKTLPDTPDRTQQELTLQSALGVPLIATQGFGATEVELAYTRARELCQQMGNTPQLFPALRGLWNFYNTRAEFQTSRKLAEQLLTLARRQQDLTFLLGAHRALGSDLYWLGELTQARVHLEKVITLYDPQQHRSLALLYGTDPRIHCLSYAALTLWLLGYPDQALTRSQDALTLAQELSHSFSLALALYFAAWFYCIRREVYKVQERVEAAVTLSSQQEFPFWLMAGTILQGWSLAERGREEDGIEQMRQGLLSFRATGAEQKRPYFLALIAEMYGKVDHAEEGLRLLGEAMTLVDKTGERWWAAELHRLKGELLLAQEGKRQRAKSKSEVEAEASFQQALDIARQQQAKSLELRATMSLSQLWQHQGKRDEARELLAPIYDWFTEGFDTADLQEAKALLEALT